MTLNPTICCRCGKDHTGDHSLSLEEIAEKQMQLVIEELDRELIQKLLLLANEKENPA